MTEREITNLRNTLQGVVSALGRDDIAVGEVSQQDGVVHFTLSRGHFTEEGEIPAELLADKQRALVHMTDIVRKLSKEIESEHIAHAAKAGK